MSQRARLIIRTGPNAGQTVTITENNYQIGRNRQCNLVLSDSAVSRLHAALRYHNDGYYLQDAQSTGGTYVNNARINAIRIKPGDVIRIGNTEMIFEVEYQHNDAMVFHVPDEKTEFLYESTLMDNPTVLPEHPAKYEPLEITKASRPIGILKKPPYSPDYQKRSSISVNNWVIGMGLILGVAMLFFLLMVMLDSDDASGQGILQPISTPSLVGAWEAAASPGTMLIFGADGSCADGDGNDGTYTRTGNTIRVTLNNETLTYLIISEADDEIILRRNNEAYVYNRVR